MVGSIRPSVNGRASPTPPNKHPPGQTVYESEVSREDGDGPWVQPTVAEDLIVSPHMTIDPEVLRSMLQQQPIPAKSESTPNFSGMNKKLAPRSLSGEKVSALHLSREHNPSSAGTNMKTNLVAGSPDPKAVAMKPKSETGPNYSGIVKKKSLSPRSTGRELVNEQVDPKKEATSKKKSEETVVPEKRMQVHAVGKEKEPIQQKSAVKNKNRNTAGLVGRTETSKQSKETSPKQIAAATDTKFEVTTQKKSAILSFEDTNAIVPNAALNDSNVHVKTSPMSVSVTPQMSANVTSADETDNVSMNDGLRPRRPVDLQMNLDICEEISASASGISDPSKNYFTSDYVYPEGILRDTAVLGRDLYLRFLHEEMKTVHVREPPCMDPWRAARLDLDYSQSLNSSVRIRKSLRQVADVFASSEHREQVRVRAAEVNLQSLDYTSFHDMMYTLFQEGGMTSERIIVLFYFCADLTIRALNEQMTNCFHQLIEWSQFYIVGTLSIWVQRNGGWSAVLDQSANIVYTAAKFGLICASIAALCILIRRVR